jgi:hypothetical protein
VQTAPNFYLKRRIEMKTAIENIIDQKTALDFLSTMDGQIVLLKALHCGISQMEKVPEPRTEVSNISDMQWILKNIFDPDKQKRLQVIEFMGTMRGHLIMSQAFTYAIYAPENNEPEVTKLIRDYVWNFPV